MKGKGFTLIELAIILIIGLLIGLGAGLLGPLTRGVNTPRVRRQSTQRWKRSQDTAYGLEGFHPKAISKGSFSLTRIHGTVW